MILAAREWKERAIHVTLIFCALVSVVTTLGIIWVLLSESLPFFRSVPPWDFLFGTEWAPRFRGKFGVLPLACGTFLVAVGALLVSVPVGVGSALYLSEYAPSWLRQLSKPILEILAGIPTVVYGYFALTFVTPELLMPLLPEGQVQIFNAASAALVVGIMITPTICSLSDDAFRAVPRTLRDAAYALSATRLEVSTRVVLPAGLSGVFAAVLLAFARAIGETMAVTLAAGLTPKLTLNPLESIQTMTAFIVEVSSGETEVGSMAYQALFAVGLTLFAITLTVNIVAQRLLARFREAYE